SPPMLFPRFRTSTVNLKCSMYTLTSIQNFYCVFLKRYCFEGFEAIDLPVLIRTEKTGEFIAGHGHANEIDRPFPLKDTIFKISNKFSDSYGIFRTERQV